MSAPIGTLGVVPGTAVEPRFQKLIYRRARGAHPACLLKALKLRLRDSFGAKIRERRIIFLITLSEEVVRPNCAASLCSMLCCIPTDAKATLVVPASPGNS